MRMSLCLGSAPFSDELRAKTSDEEEQTTATTNAMDAKGERKGRNV
jgi:hypothetical protein